jgi:HK97 family phage major capsid protein
MIDILREESIVMGLGATTFNAVGDVNVPRKASGTTAYWFGADDGDSITESDFNFGEIQIRPKYVAALTKASYRMLSQTGGTNNAVDSMIERDLMAVLAEALDNAALNGTGSNSQPTGIINQSNILTDTWTGSPSVFLWDDVLEMERLLIANKSLRGNLGALVDPTTYKSTKSTVKSSGDGLGFLSEDGMLNGYPYRATTHMPANSVLFGNWQDLLIATFGGISLEVAQPGADFAKGTTSFRAILGTDIAVRHPESFVLSTIS